MFSYNWSKMHDWLFFKKRIRLILICCNTFAFDKSNVITSFVNATNFKINLLICILNKRRHFLSKHVFQKTTSTTISMHRWTKTKIKKNDMNEYSNQKLFVKDFDVSNNEIENVAKSKSKRKIKIETKMIVFDERNLIEVSNYQEFEFEFDDNMKYDDTILST